MTFHQLDMLIAKIPTTTNQILSTLVGRVKEHASAVKAAQDVNLLQSTIEVMSGSSLEELKKLLVEKKINDQSFAGYLTEYFIPEARAMKDMIEVLNLLNEVLEKTFVVQCINVLWTEQGGGFFTFKQLKSMCEIRMTELSVMRKHGMMEA